MSRIGESAKCPNTAHQIKQLEAEIKMIRAPEEPLPAERLFENKMFNVVKQRMPHLPFKEIHDLIMSQWKYSVTDDER